MPPYGQSLEVIDATAFIPTDPKARGAMVLVAQRGPIGEARRVSSWPEFERVYGGHVPGYVGSWCAKRALENGCILDVSRVVHLATPTDLSTRTSAAAEIAVPDRAPVAGVASVVGTGTFPARLAPGQTLVVSVSGGGDLTATFRATPAEVLGAGATYAAVTAGYRLRLLLGGVARDVAFGGAENTQAAFLAAINAAVPGLFARDDGGEVELVTDQRGSSAALSVLGTTDADVLASLGLSVGAGTNAGPNNVADIEAVTLLEYSSIVETAVAGVDADADADDHPRLRTSATGLAASVRVQNTSTALAFGFDNVVHAGTNSVAVPTLRLFGASDGTWAHDARLVIDDDPREPATRFRLRVLNVAGQELQPEFAGLSMDPGDPAYVVTALSEGESLFLAEDMESAATAPADRPLAGTYTPAGGNDGLSGLTAADWLGTAEARNGVHALDVVRGFRLVTTPGMTDHTVQQAIDAWAVARLDCRYAGSVPLTVTTPSGAVAYRRRTAPFASGTATDSAGSSLYAGWHEILNPATRAPLWVPIDGELFAALARGAKADGIWSAPAGPNRAKLDRGVRRPRIRLSDANMRALADAGVNAVFYDEAASGLVIEGQKTLQVAASALDRLNVGLLTDFIGESLLVNIRVDRYEPNDSALWRGLRNKADRFLEALAAKRGAVSSFRIVCDDSINTPDVVASKRTRVHAFFVPVETSEEQAVRLVVSPQGTSFET